MKAKRKFKVALSVRLKGSFTVRAEGESDAEAILLKAFKAGEVKLCGLKSAGETSAFCVREVSRGRVDFPADECAAEGEAYICPNSQQPCDEDCSWAEKANCEYYQGLCAGRAESEK